MSLKTFSYPHTLGLDVRYYTEDIDNYTEKGMYNTVTFTISMAIRF